MLLRAFDKTVRRKPLAGAVDAGVLWELNRFLLESHCKKRSCAKTMLLMLISISLLASSELILTPEGQSVKTTVRKQFRRLRLIHAVASAARAASF